MKPLLFLIAPINFRDEEYFAPKEILSQAKIPTKTASKNVKIAQGKLGGETKVDIDITNINTKDYEGIILVGGPGASLFREDDYIHKILKEFKSQKKLIAAICIAPATLARAGLLKGKKACVFFSDDDDLGLKIFQEEKVIHLDAPIVIENNIITAAGPEYAKEFGEEIKNYFKKSK